MKYPFLCFPMLDLGQPHLTVVNVTWKVLPLEVPGHFHRVQPSPREHPPVPVT